MVLTYTFDLGTAVGQVRSLIGDAPDDVGASLTGTPRTTWKCALADEEVAQALTARGGSLLEAASDLLLRMASTQALLEVAINVNGYERNPKGVAAALRALAAEYRTQAALQPAEAIVGEVATVFQAREQILRAALDQIPGWRLP